MLTQLREEEQQYIDDILSNGLEEIMDIPSFEASTISNVTMPIKNNDYLTYSVSSGNNNNLIEGSHNLNNVHLNFDYGTNNMSNTSQDNMYLNLSKNSKKIEFNNDHINNNPFDNKQKIEVNSVIIPETPTLNFYNCESRKNEVFLNNITNNEKFDKYKSIQDDKYKISELYNNDIKNDLNNSALSNEHNIINNEKYNINDEKQKYSTFNFKNINLNLNEDLPLKIEDEKVNDSFLVLPMNIPNNREIIQSALLNNQKNLNKLNKQISGETLVNSTNNNNKNDVDIYELSISTKKLIDKYIDLKISTYSKKDTITNNSNNTKNEKNELNQILENNKKDNNNLKESQSNLLLNENSSINDMTSSLLGKNSKNSFSINSNMEQNNTSDINNSEILKVNELSEVNHINNKNKKDFIIIEQPIKNVNFDKCQNLNDDKDKKKKEKKYKPRSSALKKLINKLKKEEELYDNNCVDSYKFTKKSTNYDTGKRNINSNNNNNNNNNNSSINSFQINESELFTLGNSNISLSTLNSKKPKKNKLKEKEKYNIDSSITFRKNKKYKKSNSSVEFKYDNKFYPRTGITTAKSKDRNLKKYEKILSSKERYDILKEEMNSIQAQIKNISERINLGNSSKRDKYLKKTYSAKLIKMNSKKNKYLNLSSISSLHLDEASYTKKKKSRPLSVNCSYDSNKSGQKTKKGKEEKIYKNKYKELREKFDLQREKMKSEKQNILSLQQKIKILEKKHEKYPELVEYNNTLNEQNIMLKNNLNILDNVRKKQSLLIEALKNEIYEIKNNRNFLNKKENYNDNDNENDNYNDSNNFNNESEEIKSDHLEN